MLFISGSFAHCPLKVNSEASHVVALSEFHRIFANIWALIGVFWSASTFRVLVARSSTMHPQSPPLTFGGTVLKESDDLVALGVAFDSKMTFEKHLRFVSREVSQRHGS